MKHMEYTNEFPDEYKFWERGRGNLPTCFAKESQSLSDSLKHHVHQETFPLSLSLSWRPSHDTFIRLCISLSLHLTPFFLVFLFSRLWINWEQVIWHPFLHSCEITSGRENNLINAIGMCDIKRSSERQVRGIFLILRYQQFL